jgi:hypothetical protein
MIPHSVYKVLGYSRQRDWGGEIGEEVGCVEGQSVVVGQTSDVLVRLGGDVVCGGAAERVHRWKLVSFRAAARMAEQSPEKEERDKHHNQRQRQKRSKTKTYHRHGCGRDHDCGDDRGRQWRWRQRGDSVTKNKCSDESEKIRTRGKTELMLRGKERTGGRSPDDREVHRVWFT